MPDTAVYIDWDASTDTQKAADLIQQVIAPGAGGCALNVARLVDRRVALLNALKTFAFAPDQPIRCKSEPDSYLLVDGALFCDPGEESVAQIENAALSRSSEDLLRLNGQFNAVLYRSIEKQVVVVTDRFGSRPLYYWSEGNRHIIASEIKAVLAGARRLLDLSTLGVLELFAFGHNLGDRTVLENVHLLPPGSVIEISEAGFKATPYYRYRYKQRSGAVSLPSIGEEIAGSVKAGVARSLKGEGRKGIFLSGGLDSRIIAGPMAGSMNAFTFGYPEARDVKYASLLSKELDFDHQVLTYPEIYLSKVITEVVARTECQAPFYHATSLLFHDAIAEKADRIYVGFCGDVFSGGHLRPGMFKNPPKPVLAGMIFDRALCCSKPVLARIFREDIFPGLWDRFVRGFRATLETIKDQRPPDIADVWDVENRQRRFTFSAPKVDRCRFEVVAPLLDNEITDLFCSLPLKARKGQAAYKHAIVTEFPKTRYIPWAATGRKVGLCPVLENLRESSRLAKKAFNMALQKIGLGSTDLGWQFRNVGEEMRTDLDLFEEHLIPFLNSPRFPSHIFDRQGIVDITEEHRQGRIDATHILGAMLTLAVFTDLCSKWGFGD